MKMTLASPWRLKKLLTADNFEKKLNVSFDLVWLFFYASVIFFFFWTHPMNSDEGIVLAGSWALQNGHNIYSDFFSIVTPGVYYLILWTWKIFGVSYVVAKALSLIAFALSAFGLMKIIQKFFTGFFSYLLPLLFIFFGLHWPIVSYYTFNLACLIWASYFFLGYIEKRTPAAIFIAGMFSAVAFFFLWNRGIVFLAVCLPFIWLLNKNKRFFSDVLLFLAPVLLAIITLVCVWPFQLVLDNLIVFPFLHYSEIIEKNFVLFFVILSIIGLYAVILRKEKDVRIKFLLAVQILLLLSTESLPDLYHISTIIFPLLILWLLCWRQTKNVKFYWRVLVFSSAILTLYIFLKPSIINVANSYQYELKPNNEILDFIDRECDASDYLYAGPFIPNFYFETRKENPSPYSWLITNHHTVAQFNQTAESLKKFQPSCAVLNYEMVKKYNYNMNNPVDNYIKDNYYLEKTYGDFSLYKLKQEL